MKDELMLSIKIKTSISLTRLLEASRKYKPALNHPDDIAKSYNTIALNADLRKATVSDTFNAKTIPSITTLILIIEGMGFSLTDFALIYDSLGESDIKEFNWIGRTK